MWLEPLSAHLCSPSAVVLPMMVAESTSATVGHVDILGGAANLGQTYRFSP